MKERFFRQEKGHIRYAMSEFRQYRLTKDRQKRVDD